jgi:hypothetical protein
MILAVIALRAGVGGHRLAADAEPLPGLAHSPRRSRYHPLDHARQRHRRPARDQGPAAEVLLRRLRVLFYLSPITWVLIVSIDLAWISG